MKNKMMLMGAALLCVIMGASGQTSNVETVKTDSVVTHTVEMGETVMLIAKKYHTTPTDIYKLNPDAVNGISYNTVLQVPAKAKYLPKAKNTMGKAVPNTTIAQQYQGRAKE